MRGGEVRGERGEGEEEGRGSRERGRGVRGGERG